MPILKDIKLQRGSGDVTKIVRDGSTVYAKRDPAPLKLFSNVINAYSMRKVILDYTGSAIRVRRSSDNAQQDIGFDGVDLDETALLAFVGAGDGFVTVIYDQSGNNKDISRAAATSQAEIVSSGVINRLGNKPVMLFDGVNDSYVRSVSSDELSSDRASLFIVLQIDDNSVVGTVFQYNRLSQFNLLLVENLPPNDLLFRAQPGEVIIPYTYGIHQQITCSSIDGATDGTKLFIDGDIKGQDTGAWNTPSSANNLTIGASRASANFEQMRFQEIIIFTDDNAADRTVIENNQKTYYGLS